jgi:cytochrome c556
MIYDDRQFIQQLFETQTQQFQRHLSAVSENFDHKIGLIAEGHKSLRSEIRETRTELKQEIDLCNFKIDTLNQKIDGVDERLSKKIDGVAADLKAHRSDTEAHHGVYRVKER